MSELTYVGREYKDKNEPAFKKLCEAMTITHGKVNNIMGALVALSENSTVEDVIRLGSCVEDNNEFHQKVGKAIRCNYMEKIWDVPNNRSKELIKSQREGIRSKRFQKPFRYTINDTFLYRTMERMGLDPDLPNEKNYNGEYREYSVENGHRGSTIDSNYAHTVAMFYHCPENVRNAIIGNENLNKMWSERAKIERRVTNMQYYSEKERNQHPVSSTDEEWRKFQTEYVIKDFVQLVNAPDNIAKDLNDWIDYYDNDDNRRRYFMEKFPPIIMGAIAYGFKYPSEDKNLELIEEAYSVMDYIGIGVCWNFKNGERFNPCNSNDNAYRVGAMLKHVASTMRRFVADVKKGFDVDDVREILIEDLNSWASVQARGHWQFFVRKDAPTEYPDIQKKKKKVAPVELSKEEIMEIEQFVRGEKENNEKEN